MKIIVGLSGGPDSMFLTFLLSKKFGKENLILAHYNHKFRKESDEEVRKLKNIFSDYNFVYGTYNGTDFRENTLRKARYDFFKQIGWGKHWLALGHNLTDRIETSFLNLLRGGGIDGFLNMRKIDYSKKIMRPLINIPKLDILKKCEALEIPYFIDRSNFNISISRRNLIRVKIISLLENINYNFYYSFKKLYSQIESLYPIFNIEDYLVKFENKFLLFLPNQNREFFIKQLLDYFGIKDLRQGVVKEILDYIDYSKGGGFKKYGKLFFYKKQGKIFIKFDKND